MKAKTYSIDFETYYDKEISIATLGMHHYLYHPECAIDLVAVYSEDEAFSYVGAPKAMNWQRLDGSRLVALHARFDRASSVLLLLPDIELSNRDNISLFKTSAEPMGDYDAVAKANAEMGALCSFLLNWEIPEHCSVPRLTLVHQKGDDHE